MTDARYRANPVSRKDIRNYSKALRRRLHPENAEYVDIIRLMEYIFPQIFKKYNFSFEILLKSSRQIVHFSLYKSGKL